MNGTQSVNEFLNVLEHPLKAEIETVRAITLKADKKLEERVKWNAPSFYYKKDMAVIHVKALQHVHVIFIFYDGAMIDHPLLEGNYKDRRMVYFKDMADIKAKKAAFTKVVKEWVKLMEG